MYGLVVPYVHASFLLDPRPEVQIHPGQNLCLLRVVNLDPEDLVTAEGLDSKGRKGQKGDEDVETEHDLAKKSAENPLTEK